MMSGGEKKQLCILFVADSELTANSRIRFFVVDPDDIKARNIRGRIAHLWFRFVLNKRKSTFTGFDYVLFSVIRLSF
jgi:hypothetical protein